MSDLAGRITALSPERQALLRQYLEARARPREAPLSPGQERLWFLERLAPGTAAYHVPAALRLRGELDAAALERALAEVVSRHEILRTRFVERDGAPVQVVDPPPGAPLIAVDDLRSLGADEREAALEERLAAEALRTFDLAAEHPLRARLWRLGDAEHALQLVTHHIATDGWSLGIMQRELWTAYHAFSRGERPALAPLPMQYADHASAQRELLSGERLEREVAFWRAHLDGAPPTLDLPVDRPRPASLTFRGSSVEREVGAATLDALRALGREERSTLYITLLAVWHLLLARLAGVDDVVVGSPVAGRTSAKVEPLIGFFVNTIAVRADLSGDPTFRGLLRRVREAAVGALRHQDFPFDRVVEMLAPGRSSGVNPVVQTIFALEPASGAGARLPSLAMEPLRPRVEAPAKFDLSLFAFELTDRLSLGLSYSTDLFDAATAERMVAQYARLLEQIVARPDLRISELELLSAEEHERVVADWNRTATDYPREHCVHELFAEQAALTPDECALDGESGALSYAELEARSNRLAHLLRARGVGADTRVGVLLERGPELVVALLAILKAGGAYVPLDPEYPAERLAFMLRDSAAALVLSDSALSERLEDAPCPVLRLDAEALEDQPDTPPESGAGPESLAYIVYTSGSTGTPKGVMVPHRAIVRLVRGATYARFGPAETHLLLAPVTFDAATFEIWGALLNGARLAIAPPGPLSPAELGTLLERFEVRTLWLTAGLFHQVVDAAPEALRPLRQLLAGGEALSPAHCRRVLEAHPDLRLINGYGPTENTTFSCCHTIDASVGESVPIGRPIQNSRAYVLDAALRPMPIGVWGELYVGGDGVARGYLGRPGLSAERFIPDAFAAHPGARLYRTGDRVRWSTDGVLEFGGRFDQQLKVRGHRIEPGEIEAALLVHPDVAEAAVVALGEADGKRLVAYVVARGEADTDGLRTHVGERLPAYMVPAAFVLLDKLPLTRNGKLDRRALPAPEFQAANAYTAPRTPVEETLAAIWAEVLGVERVGVEDDFFQLGGHSLLATRVVSRAQAALGVELPLRLLFEHPTVAALAAQLDALRREGQQLRLHPIVPAPREGALPLSFGQERLWFLERLAPGSAAYHVPIALRLGGALDAGALENAWSEVVRRHEVLRTRYPEHEGVPAQAIEPAARVAIPVEDVASLEELREHLSAETVRPFDLAAAPPVRARLWRLAPDDHVLLICIHHIATDGWSTGLMMGELSALYAGFRDGAAPRLPQLPVQYADYAAWQREHLSGERLEAQLAYWRTRLAGAAPLELPTDRARPAIQSFRGGGVEQELGGAAVRALRALAGKTGSTPFMVLLAGWQALLGRMSGQDDVTVGTPIAGRTRRELEGLVGFFVNTLALRTDLSGDPTFGELVARVRETTLGAYQHQELPFEHLVDAIAPERSLSRNPLFQVSFALQQGTGGDSGLGGLSIAATPIRSQTAQFDLALTVVDNDERLRCALQFSTDLYDEATVRGLLERYVRLLEQAASAPDVRLSRLELLSPDERERVLAGWNRTETAFPAPRPLHELISAQAARTPGALAIEGETGTLSYAELEERANRLAHLLREHGVGPETRVGILLERTPELFVALLGVLKAGGAYVPLDPEYPAERLAFILEDSGAALLLTESRLSERIPAGGSERLHLDQADLSRRPATPPPTQSGADGLVYVLYTSGSTGRPKGALLTHDALVNRLLWMQQALPLVPGEGVLHKTAFGFDVAGWELFWPLLVGARVVLARPGGQRDPAYLARRVAEAEVSTLHFVPSMLPAFLDAVDAQPGAGASLRHVVCSGEALNTALAERTLRTLPGAVLWNLYGPTEAAIDVTAHRVASPADAQGAGGGVPLGQPIANTQTYVLDSALRPAPLGGWGELYLGGVQLARGYLARPGLTAERFVPDPYGGRPGARLYRTGDRARWRADGVLEYGGRLDEQVKVRGQRIEPGEVEAVLLSHPDVAEAAVVALGEAEEKRLVAYLVARNADTAALRTHAEARLPAYMVPSAFVVLDALPLTPNGKLDRRALPAPEFRATHAYTAPRTPVEETLAAIWAEVLRVEKVGVDDNFFELGGHSLLATRVVARAQAALGVELPLRLVFEHPTVATLAAHLETLRREGQQLRLDPIVPASREGALPLSFGQERLWFLERLTPGSAAYHVPLALPLTGALDVKALEGAWSEVVRRHEVLRTRYVEVEGAPAQAIEPAAPVPIPVEDLSRLPDAEREGELRRWRASEAARPFDLAEAPLRLRLIRMAEEEHVLLVCLHHIATDAWSNELLVRELAELYRAFASGADSPLRSLPVQYADYAVWQREHLSGERLEGQLAYWRGRLAGAPPLELPTDRARPSISANPGATVQLRVSGGTAAGVRALARAQGSTPFMVLLAGWQALLGRMSGQDDVVVGSPISGRTRPELEGVIGFFVNTLALRTDLSGEPTFRELLARVREVTLGAFQHQELPFEKVVEELAPERSLSRNPIVQVLFTHQDAASDERDASGAEAALLPGSAHGAKFDLSMEAALRGTGLVLTLDYRTDLYDEATAHGLLERYARLLEQAASAPDVRLSRLELLSASERERVLADWNRTDTAFPAPRPLHELISEQAARTPAALAIEGETGTLSYAELEERANRLAHLLREHGVGPETRVGILLERTPELFVALLGVLKAGGAYVPLDPEYPAERLAFILQDSGAALLLTHSGLAERIAGGLRLHLDRLADDLASRAATPPPARSGADGLVYVLYTSGSTGRPKGALLTHDALVNRLLWMQQALPLAPGDGVLHKTAFGFDVAGWELFWPLLVGARVVLARPGGQRDPAYLARRVAETGVSTLHFVPSMLSAFLDAVDAQPGAGASLRHVVCSGEALGTAVAERTLRTLPSAVLWNLYGPTEAAIDVTAHRVASPADAQGAGGGVPLGRPIANTQTYVLDAALRPAPLGAWGELYLGGVQLARGYLARPGLTAERFVPDPYGGRPGARLYRTGDRARWRADGVLEYGGRLDEQVKVRGQRIEPGEVEAVLLSHPDVAEAAVVALGEAEEKRLVAYLVARNPDTAALRAHAEARLPAYMVPSAFVLLDALPLTPNGKLDRRALPAPEFRAASAYTAPSTPTEETLAAIWGEVLGVERVGVEDNFFELGGTSFSAMRVVAAVRARLGHELPLAAFLLGGTVRSLAGELWEAAGGRAALVPLRTGGEGAPVFCVHPAGGEVLLYRNIVRHFPPSVRVYGLQDPWLGAEEEPGIEAMARFYVAEMRRVHPRGPYHLGGWSFGGIIAYEMARQLRAAGEEVASLILLDTPAPQFADDSLMPDDTATIAMLARQKGRMYGKEVAVATDELRTLSFDEQLEHVLRELKQAYLLPPEARVDDVLAPLRLLRRREDARRAYDPGGFDGVVTLFRARDAEPDAGSEIAGFDELRAQHPDLGWEGLAARVEVIEVPGDHVTLGTEPHARTLAALWSERLG